MDELRERTAALLVSLSDEQVLLVEDYARSLRDLDAARAAYHVVEELWRNRARNPDLPSPGVRP